VRKRKNGKRTIMQIKTEKTKRKNVLSPLKKGGETPCRCVAERGKRGGGTKGLRKEKTR